MDRIRSSQAFEVCWTEGGQGPEECAITLSKPRWRNFGHSVRLGAAFQKALTSRGKSHVGFFRGIVTSWWHERTDHCKGAESNELRPARNSNRTRPLPADC